MKCKKAINLNLGKTNQTLGFFGRAQLIRRFDGHHELIGGTNDDRATARGWCQHFAPEIVFHEPQNELVLVA